MEELNSTEIMKFEFRVQGQGMWEKELPVGITLVRALKEAGVPLKFHRW